MAEFLTGTDLEEGITNVIFEAKEKLMIVSPYIKLDNYFREIFSRHLKSPKLHIMLVFGKNENQYGKSLSADDFEFFKQFPYVSIIFVSNLHGKYYGNEKKGILTSINLYDFSFKNNVEFGVLSEISILDRFKPGFDHAVFDYCHEISAKSPAVFIKRPIIEKKMLGLSETYLGSEVLFDQTVSIIKNKVLENVPFHEFPDIIDSKSDFLTRKPSRIEFETTSKNKEFAGSTNNEKSNGNFPPSQNSFGFCIRTGLKIPFNPEKPLSSQAYQTWSQYEDYGYPEKFCHFSGEESNGQTTMSKPILKKNWSKAKAYLN